jgi:uncharacterized membrane-anchored protein YitT (DUF2179 family)
LYKPGGLIPGGFTGLTLLIQEIALRYFALGLPFSIVNYILNAVPALICFKHIGKRFALFSVLMIILSGFLTDFMPPMFIDIIQLHDTLLSAVFGGVLNALSISLCLYAGATSGGTDFIAIFISERYRKDAWNYIFAGNCVVLALAGYLFSLDKALYSIIFQFAATSVLSSLYQGYQQRTLLIITSQGNEILKTIWEKTKHGATIFHGKGAYQKAGRTLLYSVIAANQVTELIKAIKKLDPDAFVNVLKTEHINGRFNQPPKD